MLGLQVHGLNGWPPLPYESRLKLGFAFSLSTALLTASQLKACGALEVVLLFKTDRALSHACLSLLSAPPTRVHEQLRITRETHTPHRHLLPLQTADALVPLHLSQ